MKDSIFYDTSVLAYAFDNTDTKKHGIAISLLEKISNGEANGAISNQVLGELFNVLTTKMNEQLPMETAVHIIDDFAASEKWQKLEYTSETARRAAHLSRLAAAPFWDMVIVETMREHGITKLYTENTKDFKRVQGVHALNPFV